MRKLTGIGRKTMSFLKTSSFFKPKNGSGVVELVLIIVVLITLVLIFKGRLTSLMGTVFSQIDSSASSVFS